MGNIGPLIAKIPLQTCEDNFPLARLRMDLLHVTEEEEFLLDEVCVVESSIVLHIRYFLYLVHGLLSANGQVIL